MLDTWNSKSAEKLNTHFRVTSSEQKQVGTEQKKVELSDRPKVEARTERNAVQDQLPAWSKALGFSDRLVKAQKESTLQRWARKGPGFSTPFEAQVLGGAFGATAALIGGILWLIGKFAVDPQAVAVGTYALIGGFSVALAGFADHAVHLLCKAVAPLQRKNWLWGAKVTPEISEKELAPILTQFDRAGPEEQAFLGMLLEKWYENLTQVAPYGRSGGKAASTGELQGPAGVALRTRIKAAKTLPEGIRKSAERPFALYDAIFDLSGGGKVRIRDADLPQIRSAFEALDVPERQAIAPMLSGLLFASNKAKFAIENEALVYLTRVLAESNGGKAARIEAHHFVFGSDNKARCLDRSDLNKLRELLSKMSSEEAGDCRAEIRNAYFDRGRSVVKLDPNVTIDLWEMVGKG